MKEEESRFIGAGGVEIYWRAWIPDTIRGLILIAHGLGEHSGRYAALARDLGEKDIASLALDHRGHGRSGGRRGHINRFSEYLADLDTFREKAEERFKGLPCFLLGHSMGGLIAVRYAEERGAGLSGLILSSPALRVEVEAPKIKLALGRFFSKVLPFITMSNGLDPAFLSHNPEVVEAYKNDPLVHDRVSARWFTEFTKAIEEAHEHAHKITIPVLLMQSADDKMVAAKGATEFFERLTVPDKTIKIWDGFYHEMFNEVQREKPVSFLIEWLEKHIEPGRTDS